MKQFFLVLVVMLFVIVFTSCQKEEVVLPIVPEIQPVEANIIISKDEILAYKVQMITFAIPPKGEILAARPAGLNLKSGSADDKSLSVRMFVADSSSFYFYINEFGNLLAVRPIIYYEFLSGFRKEYLTANQEFLVINGKIQVDNYSIKCEFACPYGRYFSLRNNNYVSNVNYLFLFDDKTISPISYFGNGFNGTIKLPPIPGGHWELLVTKDDGDFRKEYSTGPIDYFRSYILDLQYQLKQENTVATVKIDPTLLSRAKTINLIGYDLETGRQLIMSYVVSQTDNSSRNYDAPFDISAVTICSNDQGCWWYEVKIVGINSGNISQYEIIHYAG